MVIGCLNLLVLKSLKKWACLIYELSSMKKDWDPTNTSKNKTCSTKILFLYFLANTDHLTKRRRVLDLSCIITVMLVYITRQGPLWGCISLIIRHQNHLSFSISFSVRIVSSSTFSILRHYVIASTLTAHAFGLMWMICMADKFLQLSFTEI